MNTETHTCYYCGGNATYQLKHGKWCCRPSRNSCPEIRRKNSNGCKRAYRTGKRISATLGKPGWNRGLTKETDQRVAKGANEMKRRCALKEINTGHPQTEYAKQRLRALRLKEIEERGIAIYSPNFSKRACEYIDHLNESKGWNLQHALNGGETRIDNYFLDGYDKVLNIAFEYDEPRHYLNVEESILRESDVVRMQRIYDRLKCRFFRYNEQKDTLYEVIFSGTHSNSSINE